MKKLTLLMAAFALVLGFSQCSKKPVMPSYSGPAGGRIIQHVDMSASYGGGDNNSKLEIGTGSAANLLSLTWSEDESDRINVFQMINKEEKSITTDESGLPIYNIKENGKTAHFKGDIMVQDTEEKLIFRSGKKPASEDFMKQEGKLDYIKSNLLCVEGTSKYEESGIYNVEMTLPYAVLLLDLSAFGDETKDGGNEVKINVKGDETPVATVTGVTKESKAMYVALPAEEKQNSESLTEKTYVFICGDKKVEKPFKIGYGAFFTAGGTGGAEVIKPAVGGTVTTVSVENVTAESADVNYSIEPYEDSQATEHGVVYSTSENPDLDYGTVVPYTAPGKGENYVVKLTGLTVGTKYYARAYAKYVPAKDGNEVIVYGEQKDFTTLEAPAEYPYLCFTAVEAGNYQVGLFPSDNWNWFPIDFQTSTDKITWTDYSIGLLIGLENDGDKVYFRRKGKAGGLSSNPDDYMYFKITGNIAVSGNIMSLINPTCESTEIPCNYCFCKLFSGCTTLTDASELKLPAIDLKEGCYSYMFEGCESLKTAPELPATNLVPSCYESMFSDCESLETAHELNATELAVSCHESMFSGCTSLTEAPDLPANVLAENCCKSMFSGCSMLTGTTTLTATELVKGCYESMFSGCSELNEIIVYFETWDAESTTDWVKGVSSEGTFLCPSNLPQEESDHGDSKIPFGWSVGPLF